MKKQLIIAGTTLAVGLSTLAGAGIVHAATAPTASGTDKTSLVDKIATKFNLKSSDVQTVFDQDHTERRAQHEADQKAKLDQAVKDGKLTQAQEDQINSFHKEIKDLMGTSRPGEQDQATRDKIKAKMDEVKQWATENKVDLKYIHPGGGRHHSDGPDKDGPNETHSSTTN